MRTHRRESRELWGFKHFPTALRACALRIDPQERFDPVTSTFVVGDPTGPDGQYVEVLMDLNAASLAEQAEVNLDDLELVLTFRNRESRLLLPLWRIGASGHPRKWGGRIPADRVSPRRYQLTLQLSLANDRERELGQAWRTGSILASRSWTVTNPDRSSLFNIDWTSFSDKGWDRDAIWRVEFMSADGFDSASPEETLNLHINKDLEALRSLFQQSARRSSRLAPITAVLVPMVLSAVTTEIITRVLRWAHPLVVARELDLSEVDGDSLAGRVVTAVGKLGFEPSEAARLTVDEPETFVTLVQGGFNVGRSLDGAALERMMR